MNELQFVFEMGLILGYYFLIDHTHIMSMYIHGWMKGCLKHLDSKYLWFCYITYLSKKEKKVCGSAIAMEVVPVVAVMEWLLKSELLKVHSKFNYVFKNFYFCFI